MSKHRERWERIRKTNSNNGSVVLKENDFEWLMGQSKTFREMIEQFGEYHEEKDELSDFYHDFRRMFIDHHLDQRESEK